MSHTKPPGVLMAVLLLGAAVWVSGCGGPSPWGPISFPATTKLARPPAPAQAPAPKEAKTEPPLKIDPGPAPIKLTVDELVAELGKDDKAFVARYDRKTVELAGKVAQIFSLDEASGQRDVALEASDSLAGFTCLLRDAKRSARLGKGQTIRLKGRVQASAGSVRVTDGEIIELGPDTAVHTSAEDFAGEFTTDRKKARKQFRDRTIIVTGVITEKVKGPGEGWTVTLKGDAATVVGCELLGGEKAAAEKMQVGQRVTLAAAFSAFGTDAGRAALINGLVLEGP
jgi:hypothetical protein